MGLFLRERRWRSERRAASPGKVSAPRRLAVLGGIVVVCFLALSAQLFRLQVLNTGYYQLQAEDNRLRLAPVSPARGLIYDRHGRAIAENVAAPYAVVIPGSLPKGREAEVYAALESLLRVPVHEVEGKVARARRANDPYTPIVIKRELDRETMQILRERESSLPGVKVEYEPVRRYPYGDLLAHLLGYTGRVEPEDLKAKHDPPYQPSDRTGKAGIELTYEGYLRGAPGRETVEVDAAGRTLRRLDQDPAQHGYNLVTTIDVELQREVRRILEESVRDLDSKKAVALLMDVRSGELLAYVSLPTYDNNIFSGELDEAKFEAITRTPDKPLLDHAIAEKFPPGSTFKLVTGAAALQEGIAKPGTTITSNGALLVPRDYDPTLFDSFPDWRAGLGPLNFYRGVAMSSDVYFYCLAGGQCPDFKTGLGSERLAKYARAFGYGEPTGIDLPGETDGLVGDAVWLKKVSSGAENWFLADTFYLGIGQGYMEATPLQVVRMTAAIANGGRLLRPKVVREIRDSDGGIILPARTEVSRQTPVSEDNLAIVREAMRQAVADGTATSAQVPGVTSAGKTGTAEFGARLGAGSVYGKYKEHGWYTGFAPFENPEVAVVVFHYQGGGALTAAPTAGRILRAYFDLKNRPQSNAAPAGQRER